MEKNETITITREEYFRLKCAEMHVDLLERGGVDNWEWYGESLNPDGEVSWDERVDQLRKEILG